MRTTRFIALAAIAAAACAGVGAGIARAQDAAGSPASRTAPAPDAAPPGAAAAGTMPVGGATGRLLALQRGGAVASPVPRPIAGEVADLSYRRYLDSFRRPIPEHFSTTVRSAGATRAAP